MSVGDDLGAAAGLAGRVVAITGAGRGLGREYALLLAQQGAQVVVNDLGAASDGQGIDQSPAEAVVAEIREQGGDAVASTDDVADWAGGENLVATALEAFGRLDVLVNNAGIVRGAGIADMDEHTWDQVISVHLKGHFVPLRFAARHWRDRSKSGEQVNAAVVNSSSIGGLLPGLPRQANYVAAKAGIAGLTMAAACELEPYGVRVNAVVPNARTRLTEQDPISGPAVAAPEDPEVFDLWNPANVAPLVAYLSSPACPFNGGVFHAGGREVGRFDGWRLGEVLLASDGAWTVQGLAREADGLHVPERSVASAPVTLQEAITELYARHEA